MAAPKFHELTIQSIDHTTADAVVLEFHIPDALKPDYRFTPGQYLTLRADIDGEDVRRSYSICSPLGSPNLKVGVKRIDGGLFSNHALNLAAGDRLRVMTPQGRFTAPIAGKHDYLLLAAGSGITPMVSIASSVLAGEPESTVTLCYANRTTDSVMFKETFEDLKDRYMTRFLLTHVMDEETQDVELFNGRLDAEKLATLTTRGLIDPDKYHGIYICGPQPMIEAASSALEELGAPKDRIKFELFTPSTPLPIASDSKQEADITAPGAKVEIILDGSIRSFNLPQGDRLLDAAAKSGLDLPYSCANGMCATCRCKLVSGEASMIQNFSLEKWEEDSGFVLACQLQPSTDKITLDFDAV